MAPSAAPNLFERVRFEQPANGDLGQRIEALVELYRDEKKTAEERREWAESHGAVNLPDERTVDELLKFRYDQIRGDWAAALYALLIEATKSGNERLLISTLDQSVPADARRVAARVAVAERVQAAVAPLCAAAIHKTQVAFGSDAVRALSDLAPERLPLIALAAQPDVAAAVDRNPVSALPEHAFLERLEAQAVEAGSGVEDVRGDVLLHLVLALPLERQLRVLETTRDTLAHDRLCAALHSTFTGLVERESPTGYEQLLRAALSQAILAEGSNRAVSHLRVAAHRVLVRDAELARLQPLVTELPEAAAAPLVRTAIELAKGDRLAAVLQTIADSRPGLASAISDALKQAIRNGEIEGSVRLLSLRLLAADPESHHFVAREAERELTDPIGPDKVALTTAIVLHEVPLDYARTRRAGKTALLRALPVGSARYAASILKAIHSEPDADEAWTVVRELHLPESWLGDSQYREALIGWLDTQFTSVAGPSIRDHWIGMLAVDAPTHWVNWSATTRATALTLLEQQAAEVSVPVIAAIAAALGDSAALRKELVASLAGTIIPREPSCLARVTSVVSVEELQPALIDAGAGLEQRIAERKVWNRDKATEAGQNLASDLIAELKRAMSAVAPDDQLSVLLARIDEVVRSSVQATEETEPAIVEYLQAFPGVIERSEELNWPEALVAALKGSSARSRSSQASLAFFRRVIERILESKSREQLEGFVSDHRKALDRLDLASVEPVAVALLQQGARTGVVRELLGGASDPRSIVTVALRVGRSHKTRALELLRDCEIDLRSLADAVATRKLEWSELEADTSGGRSGALDLARRVVPILEAIEGLLLNYLRLRRVFLRHGFAPVEPIPGEIRQAGELQPGLHRVLGLGVADGSYEVRTMGMRSTHSGEVVAPSTVARQAEEHA